MRFVLRSFFKILRILLGPIVLLWEFVTRPRGLVRHATAQAAVDQQCRSMVLYQYQTCPFCIKVRQELRRLSLNVEFRDAQKAGKHREALMQGGGQLKVPCLRITEPAGNSRWLYESAEIVAYLRGRFAA